jgi:hypothetical protein
LAAEAQASLLGRQVGQQDLAEAGRVRRQALADLGLEADRVGAVDLGQVDVLDAVEDGELDRLVQPASSQTRTPREYLRLSGSRTT